MTFDAVTARPLSPWLSVWLRPRDTIERILAGNPKRHVLLLAGLGGISAILGLLIGQGLTTQLVVWPIFAAVVVVGAASGILSLYVSAFFLRWSSKLLGGRASQVKLRAVIAWSVVPGVLGLAICLVALTELKLFAASGTFGVTPPTLISALRWLTALLGLWSWIAMMLMLARVQGFGFWRTIVNVALGSLLLPILLALIVRTFFFQPFDIPSGAMMPTLLIGDYFFVSKYAYGYTHYSLPFSPRLFSGRVLASEPRRGDVVLFRLPSADRVDYIKRLIGLPGDRVQMRAGVLYINGEPVKRERVDDFVDTEYGHAIQVQRWRETLANGVSYETLKREENRSLFQGNGSLLQDNNNFLNNTPEYKVPAGHYFMIGDNRDNSNDSRNLSGIGFIPFENLVGRAERIFLSIDRTSPTGQQTLRFERLGVAVQ